MHTPTHTYQHAKTNTHTQARTHKHAKTNTTMLTPTIDSFHHFFFPFTLTTYMHEKSALFR